MDRLTAEILARYPADQVVLAALALAAALLLALLLLLRQRGALGRLRRQASTDAALIAELELLRTPAQKLPEVEAALAAARTTLAEAAETRIRLESALASAQTQAARLPALEDRLERQAQQATADQSAIARLTAEMRTQAQAHEARLEELRGLKKEMEDRFAALASGALKTNSDAFLNLVSERFQQHSAAAAEDLARRQLAIQNLVKPLDEKLGVFDSRIKEIETARTEAYGAIRAQIQSLGEGQATLGQETRKLVQALRAPKTRGRWGEMQLRQVFEMAGMAEHVDFTLEHHIATEGGALRPDAVVRIPGGKSIVVDAKTPLEAYLDALDAETPELQTQHLARHANHIRGHVKLLASKAYQQALKDTPDFVVMFIPGETFVSAAAEVDPQLIDHAFQHKVLVATPTTLMALVKAIAYGWQQEKMAENAAQVQVLARELYERLGVFAGHVEKIGRALGQSVDSYNRAVASLEGRVLPTARKFERLGVVPAQTQIAEVVGVEAEPRTVTAPELVPDPAPLLAK